jgi:hypothetical protein
VETSDQRQQNRWSLVTAHRSAILSDADTAKINRCDSENADRTKSNRWLVHFAQTECFHIVDEFVEVGSGKGHDALDRRPPLRAALGTREKAPASPRAANRSLFRCYH